MIIHDGVDTLVKLLDQCLNVLLFQGAHWLGESTHLEFALIYNSVLLVGLCDVGGLWSENKP